MGRSPLPIPIWRRSVIIGAPCLRATRAQRWSLLARLLLLSFRRFRVPWLLAPRSSIWRAPERAPPPPPAARALADRRTIDAFVMHQAWRQWLNKGNSSVDLLLLQPCPAPGFGLFSYWLRRCFPAVMGSHATASQWAHKRAHFSSAGMETAMETGLDGVPVTKAIAGRMTTPSWEWIRMARWEDTPASRGAKL